MLQLKNITKSYKTGNFEQKALDGVSVSFRDNEFVAILGPSGAGKTTLLNIIGGLDSYDGGDLVIDGISTKNYKDRDWDTYRNNRCGFVFQSYNLIPHQSVLANVELALTLSGVGRDERRRRAEEALQKVGLGEHINKRPNQLSGGQMQRVAIARALINDPEILLADEPTGALDSKTSVQIMDLLTEIASERLVVMVTHNPELAAEYATRTVNIADGQITDDSNPFVPTTAELDRVSDKKIRRTSMNFLTALSLSFNNLMSKKGRTIMTAFAGSIGIIGIAGILALANGVNNYIATVEEETLSSYPLQIASTGFDMTSIVSADIDYHTGSNSEGSSSENNNSTDQVEVISAMNRMFESVGSNDLKSLKEYIESGKSDIDNYVNDIEYKYNVTPYVYLANTDTSVQRVNPDSTFGSLGIGSSMSTNSLMSSMMSTNMFSQLNGTIDMAKEGFDLKAGRWPEKPNECILALTPDGGVSDFLLYILGLRDRKVMDDMVKAFMNGEEIVTDVDNNTKYSYDDFLNLKLKVACSADFYQYDKEFGVWVDKSSDYDFMKNVVDNSEDLIISGIVQKNPDNNTSMMRQGIYYMPSLTDSIIDKASKTEIVKEQLAKPNVDVFNGKLFSEEDNSSNNKDMGQLFSVDSNALKNAFKFDSSAVQLDQETLAREMQINPNELPAMPELSSSMNPSAFAEGSAKLTMGFLKYCQDKQISPSKYQESYAEYMKTPEAQTLLATAMKDAVNADAMQAAVGEYVANLSTAIQQKTQMAVAKAMGDMTSGLAGAFKVDEAAFKNAFKFNMTEEELSELMMSMMSKETASFDSNIAKLDYAQLDKPSEIDIFVKDFEAKQHVIDILDAYNKEMNDSGQESKAVTYTDIVGVLMKSVTTIIDMISYVLIAFVSISLVVSSIMIGIITYISVLERRKEIGILRAIGASKKNIAQIFNAETIIEGLTSGLFGVCITALMCIPANIIVYTAFDVPNVALLPVPAAIILIAISVILSFVAGLIPARRASKSDPVEALRSE